MGRGRTTTNNNGNGNINSSRLRRKNNNTNSSYYYSSSNNDYYFDSMGNDAVMTTSVDDIKSSGHYNSALHSIDKCHNDSIPCCNAIREIVCDIFPDITISEELKGQQGNINTDSKNDQNNKNKGSSNSSSSSSSSSDCKKKTAPSRKSSLLSLIIRQYLLDERQKQRSGGSGSSSIINQNNNGSAAGSSTNQKKKRKKKKKKQASTVTTAAASTIEAVPAAIVAAECNSDSSPFPISQTAISSEAKNSNDNGNYNNGDNNKNNAVQGEERSTKIKPVAEPFKVLLDQILIQQQGQQQQSSCLKSSSISSDIILSPPKNRTLQSLFDYIHTKYNNHESKSTSSATRNKKGNNNNNSNSGSHANGNSNNTASYCSRSSSTFHPSIPLRELSDCICNNIKCIPCKRATEQYIDAISKPSIKSSNYNNYYSSCAIDWGDVGMNLNKSTSSRDNKIDGDDDRIKKKDDSKAINTNEIRSFRLDSESVLVSAKQERNFSPDNKNAMTLPGPDGFVHDNNDHDFDHDYYALMEEGNSGSAINATEKEYGDGKGVVEGEDGLMLNIIKVQNSGAKYVEIAPSEYPLTLRRFINLMKEVVVPCGLNELENYDQETSGMEGEDGGGRDVSKDVILDLRQRYNNLSNDIYSTIRRIEELFKESQDCLDDAVSNSGPSTKFGIKASQALLNCEKIQFAYMEEFARLLNRMHTCTAQARLIKHDDRKWITEFLERLWDNYEDSIKSFVEPSLQHMWKVIQLNSKHTGSVPQMYNCPVTRTYLIEMLSKKQDIMKNLLQRNTIDKLQQHRVEKNASSKAQSFFDYENTNEEQPQNNLDRILLLSSYFSWLIKDEEVYTNPSRFDCKSITTDRIELVCRSISRSKVSSIIELQSSRIANLRCTGRDYANQVDGQSYDSGFVVPNNYASFWNANKILIEEMMMQDEILCVDERSFECDLPEMTNLCTLVEYINKQCRLSEDIERAKIIEKHSSGGQHHKVPKWIKKIFITEEEEEKQSIEAQPNAPTTKCDGGGGKRRLMCILSACLYSWIEERCMEWHADLTQEELLLDADEELANLSKVNTGLQRSKKSKKKKRKSSGKKETNPTDHTNKENTNECCSQIEPILKENELDSGDQANAMPEESEFEYLSKEEKKDNDPEAPAILAKYTHDQSVEEANDEEEDFDINYDQFEDYNFNISVYDRTSEISVEDYLSERFCQILKDGEFVLI